MHQKPSRGRCFDLPADPRYFILAPIYMVSEKAADVILASAN
jgi:hypothetical protein